MTTRLAVLSLSLVCLATAACSTAETVEEAADAAGTVDTAVTDGTPGPEQVASATASTGESPGRRRSRVPPDDNRAVQAPPADIQASASDEPAIAAIETVNREMVHGAPPLIAAAPATPASPAPVPPAIVLNDRIYSDQDADVTPAVLLTTKQAGPLFTGVKGSVNRMELVVSREGRVETVRLLTPAMRMTDMLLLSGAKTWKFAPALKEGQPVRYRTQFSWESTP